MRLLFVDNIGYNDIHGQPEFDLQPHAGLMSLVAVARQGGHAAGVLNPKWELTCGRLRLDESLYEELPESIVRHNPDVVGFTALGCNFALVIRLASQLKRLLPGVPILLGGPHATILHREILERFEVFDVIARHEAEDTLLPLLERLDGRRFGDLPGVSYRSAGGNIVCNPGNPLIGDLDTLPHPAYDAYPIAEYGLEKICLEAGRGCPFSCTFCSTATFFGRRYRLKSTERLVGEMDQLNVAYGFTAFLLTHDLFTVNRKKVLEFCEAVRDRNYTWSCSARVDCVDDELLRAMAGAGCRGIYFGIETGSLRMQALSCKRLDLELVEPTIALAAQLGMATTTSFITGYPEEEAADQAATLDLLGRLALRADGKTMGQLHMLAPEPGTALIAQYGSRLQFDGQLIDFNIPLLDAADETMVAQNPKLFPNYHYYPTMLPRERHLFVIASFNSLHSIARVVARYCLRAFDSRLSLMSDAADAWRRSQGIAASAVDMEFFIAFMAASFGRSHHLVSLLRYATSILGVRLAAKSHRVATGILQRDSELRLARCSQILTDIHDCPALLARITRTPDDALLEEQETGGLTCLLIKADSASDEIATFKLDRDTATALAKFQKLKRYTEFRRETMKNGATAAWSWSDIRQLCADGVLELAA